MTPMGLSMGTLDQHCCADTIWGGYFYSQTDAILTDPPSQEHRSHLICLADHQTGGHGGHQPWRSSTHGGHQQGFCE